MKWGIFLLLGATIFASEGEETKEAVADGNDDIAKDVVKEEDDEDDHENEDDLKNEEDLKNEDNLKMKMTSKRRTTS